MEDLQTYRARIGLFRHRLASKGNIPPHKRAACRQREQKRRQDRIKLKKSRVGSAAKLNPVSNPGNMKMVSGITRRFAIFVIAILLMASVTSGHMDTDQFFTENELHTDVTESHVIGKGVSHTLQQNYVIPSSMCDCLLGNAGVHSYHGNPRTSVGDDDHDNHMETDAHAPSDGHQQQPFLEGGSVERSTIHLSQRAEQIQRLEINVRQQHADMIRELNGYISPELPSVWDLFRNGLTPYLTPVEIYGTGAKFIWNHCESLLRKGIIKHGEYSVLLQVVNSVDFLAGEIVRRTTTNIKEIQKEISDLKPEARKDRDPRLTHKEQDRFSQQSKQSYDLLKAATRPNERTIDVNKRGNMIDQTENWVKWKRQHTTFITTNAFNVAIDILKKSKLLLIKGNCGDGKSVLALEILAWLMGDREEQCKVQHDTVNPKKKPLLLKELRSWDETIACHANLAIFIDDIFGYSSIYSDDLAWWKKILPFIGPVLDGHIGADGNCMILTVRNDVYAEHESLFCHDDVFTDGQCVVDLSCSQSLQIEEKKSILRLYMPTGIELSPDDETTIVQSDMPFGFPECCRIFQSLKDMHDQPTIYFKKPLVHFKNAIQRKFSKIKKVSLLFLLLAKGKVTESQLDSDSSNTQEDELVKLALNAPFSGETIQSATAKPEVQIKPNIKECLKSMIGSLVKSELNTFTFYHDIVEDAVAILYGEITPRGFLRNVDITHLRYVTTRQDNENALYIGNECMECLYSRILDELKTRKTKQYDILTTLRVWDEENFVRDFIAWVGKQENVPNDFYFLWTTKECTRAMKKGFPDLNEDGINNFSFFVFVAKSNKDYLLQQLIEQGKPNTIQMKLALDEACAAGSVTCALRLIENGVIPDSNTWICVVKEGSLDLLNKLISISSDEYPNATTDEETFNVKNVNMLQLACLHEKEQVALRLAQKFPTLVKHRDNDGNSVFHHIAMTNNCNLFENISTAFCIDSEDNMSLLSRNDKVTVLHVSCKNTHPKFKERMMKMCIYINKTYPSFLSQRDNDGWHCLHDAAHSGHVDCFMYLDNLVNEGKSETKRLHYMETLLSSGSESVLHLASINGKKTMCTHLLERYPSLLSQRDNYGGHCLHNAAHSGDVDCFMYLDNLVNEGKSETERLHYMETLLTTGGKSVLHGASINGKKTMCTHLLETYPSLLSQRDNYGRHCLHDAAHSGHVDCFMYLDNLVNEGKSETKRLHYMETLLSSGSESVLHVASINGKKTMCTHLLERYPSLLSQRDNYGGHCLHNAAHSGDVDCFMYLDNLVNEGKSETERLHYMETLLTTGGKSVLHRASINGKKTMCTHLLETYPSLLSQRDNYGRHCLHYAAHSGDVDCFLYLDNHVNEGKSETERLHYMETLLTSEGESVLHLASINGKKTMCTHLLETYPSLLSQRDNYGRHCLHYAAHSGDVDCFMYLDNLVNEGKSETERLHYMETLLTSEGKCVLHLASINGKKTMCTHLLETYPSLLSQRDNNGWHCLHNAAHSGDVDCFMYLDNLVNVGKSETEKLHYMETLLTSKGESVLHVASYNGKKTMCTHLLETYPSLLSQRDNNGWHCLHNPAHSGDVDCFMYLDNLVNEGKSETERLHYMETLLTREGESVLHRASINGMKTMCKHLLETYPTLLSQRDNYGRHCLHYAAQSGDDDCFLYLDNLVNEGKSETERLRYMETLLTSKGESVLHSASTNGKKTMCIQLLETYPSLLSKRDNYGRRCLHNAAHSGDVDCFMYLDTIVNEGKSETERLHYMETLLTSKGESVLHVASFYGKKTMCTILLETYPSLLSQRDNNGWHCLHNAAHSGDVDCFMYLDNLVNEGKCETERLHYMETLLTREGESVLHRASINGMKAMCTHLLETYPSLLSQRDNYGRHCLHNAAHSGEVDCFMYLDNLVNEGKSETERLHYMETLLTSKGESVLHVASFYGKKTMCIQLLETYPSLLSKRDNYGRRCLHNAAHSGDVDCFMYLDTIVNEGKSETERLHYMETLLTSKGESVLHVASFYGKKTMCTILLETYPSLLSQRDNNGWHCLHNAAHSGDVDCFMYLDNLVNEGKCETERLHYMETLLTREGESVLHRASINGMKAMCTHLLETYPSLLSQRDNYGRHCLHNAAHSGEVDCFMYLDNLVNEGKSETERLHYMETLLTSKGESVLHVASFNGKKTMCTHLLETYPSLLSQQDNNGWHCLHKAAYSGDVDCFMYLDNLVNKGKSDTERLHYMETLLTSGGECVLHLASINGKKTMCTHLLETYPSLLSQRDNDGFHCLHNAAVSGDVDCFMYLDNLVNVGKSETEKLHYMETLLTSEGESLLHRAIINGKKTMCTHLSETYSSLLSQWDSDGWHCLHYAARSGDVDCFLYLDNLVNEGKSETERLHFMETLRTSKGESVLHRASVNGKKTMCAHLLETYPSLLSQRNNYGRHFLHDAARSGDVDCFMYLDNLVNKGKSETERLHYMETLLTSKGESVLHRASINGMKTMCKHLLETYPTLLSQRDNYGRHCLHYAAQSGDDDCFLYLDNLVNEGKSETERLRYMETLLTSKGESVLHSASTNGKKTMCIQLLETYPSLLSKRDNYGRRCLHNAAHSGDVDCFMYLDTLVNEGKSETERLHYMETLLSSEGESVLHLASINGKKTMCTHLLETYPSLLSQRDNYGRHCLHNAAHSGDVDCFMYLDNLVNEGKSETERLHYMETLLTSKGESVFHVASFNGKKTMCTHLLETYPSLLSQRNNYGRHFLHDAARSGDVDCFMYLDNLVNKGKSDTERLHYMETLLTSEGESVLHRASINGMKTMCTHLSETYPSLLSQRDNYGRHCLHYAAQSGDDDCFLYLDNLVNEGKSETERLRYMETLLTSKGESVLHSASIKGKKTMCTHLLETYPSLLSQQDNNGWHCLHKAAYSGDVDCFMYLDNLVNKGKSETERLHYMETLLTSGGWCVLHLASINGKKTMCTHLLETYSSLLSQRDNYSNNCLHYAAHSGDVDCFLYLDNLVNEGKSETERLHYMETLLTSEGESVLHRASVNGKKTMCTHLLETYPSLLSQRNNYGRHFLHDAARSGDVDCFMYLDNHVNKGKSDTERLHYMETLLTSEGESVLHLASINGKKTMCTHLLDTYPSLLSQRDNDGFHCLHNAAVSGDVDCFMYLDNLVNVGKSETEKLHYMETLLTSEGESVLHRASFNGKKTMCTHLLETYPSLLSQRDNYGNHCLHDAAHSGDVDCFLYLDNLVNEGKSETERLHYMETLLTSKGESVFHVASFNGKKTMCAHLLETYPSLLSQQDNDGWHCLHNAAVSGDVDCFMYLDNLVNKGKSDTERLHYMETLLTSEGESVLHLASINGKKTMCTHLSETYPSLLSQRDNDGWHCLHNAAVSGDVDCFMYLDNLVNKGKSDTERLHYMETLLTSKGESVFHVASFNGKKTMCAHLLETYPSLLSQRNNYGRHCLHYAAQSGDDDCFLYLDNLVNEGKSETERLRYMETLLTSKGESVLHSASIKGKKTMCTHLLETYPSLLSQQDNNGWHCLHKAAYSGDVDCFMYLDNLVNKGKSETERLHYMETLLTSGGESVLHLASINGKKTMCTHLSETYPSLLSQRDNDGWHCFHKAAVSGDVDCFMYLDNLVNEGKSETERLHYMETLLSSGGESVLHRASINGMKTMCTHLLETYPSLLSQRDNYRRHCLHDAAHSGDVDCFLYLDNLVNEGKSETERLHYMETLLTSEGESVLHRASINGMKTMCTHLLETYPSLLSQRDNYGRHCLHHAAKYGDVDCFMYLDNIVNEGKSETERLHYMETLLTSRGESVLHRASINGMKTMCTHLLETYPSLLSQRDNYGRHCLHNAAYSGDVDCFMYLDNHVNEGRSEPERLHYIETLITRAGDTVFHRASMNAKRALCAHLFQTYPTLISHRNKSGVTPLQHAVDSCDEVFSRYLNNLVNEGKNETERLLAMNTLLVNRSEPVLHPESLNKKKKNVPFNSRHSIFGITKTQQ